MQNSHHFINQINKKLPIYEDPINILLVQQRQVYKIMEKDQNQVKKKQNFIEKVQPKSPNLLDTKQQFLAEYQSCIRKSNQNEWELELIDCNLKVSLLKEMPVNHIQKIQMLNLEKNYIRDQGLAILAQIEFPNLKRLILEDCGLKSLKGIAKFNKLSLLFLLDNDFEGSSNMLDENAARELVSAKWQNLRSLSLDFKMPNQYYETWLDPLSTQDSKAWKIFISNNFQAFPKLQDLYSNKRNIGYTNREALTSANQKFASNRIKIHMKS